VGALPVEAEKLLSWLADEKGRSVNTVAAYRRDLAAYGGYLDDRGLTPGEVTEPVVEDYVAHLRSAGRAPASVARALVSVRALHRFLETDGHATGNPAGRVEPPRVPTGPPPVLSEEEASSLLAAVVGDDAIVRRDRAIVEVLYACGLRVSELVGLSVDAVGLDAGLLRVNGDGQAMARERVVPVGDAAVGALAGWLTPRGRGALVPTRWARRGDAEALFLNARGGRLSRQAAWRIVNHYGEKVGLTGRLSPNVLRHSCAAHMIARGADIGVVRQLLGQASPSPTQSPNQSPNQSPTGGSADRLRPVYRAAHPRAGGGKPR